MSFSIFRFERLTMYLLIMLTNVIFKKLKNYFLDLHNILTISDLDFIFDILLYLKNYKLTCIPILQIEENEC